MSTTSNGPVKPEVTITTQTPATYAKVTITGVVNLFNYVLLNVTNGPVKPEQIMSTQQNVHF
jgi:hypothetical protein